MTKKILISAGLFFACLLAARMATAQPHPAEPLKFIGGPPRVEGVGTTWAVIAWSTETGGSTVIHYGTNPGSLTQTAEAPYQVETNGHATHRVHVNNLKPGTTYYFQVESGQGQGTGTDVKGSVMSFTTKPAGAPGSSDESREAQDRQAVKVTAGPVVEGVGDTWAVIAWQTNVASNTLVRYGTDNDNLNEKAIGKYADNESTPTQVHRAELRNLKPNTTYYYLVDSGQAEGTGTETRSRVESFKTKAR